VCLVEWPEHASGIPTADWRVTLRESRDGRHVDVYADTELGKLCLDRMQR
jgi:tRNA A37 threonylcarbamoyladenosine biosynthesis protein TsaE